MIYKDKNNNISILICYNNQSMVTIWPALHHGSSISFSYKRCTCKIFHAYFYINNYRYKSKSLYVYTIINNK